MTPYVLLAILYEAGCKSIADRVPRLGAALAFYMTFSLAPLLVIVIAIAGFVFGRKAAEGRLISEIGSLVGEDAANSLQLLIVSANRPGSGMIASVIGGAVILVGAIGLFCELQDALNTVFEVPGLSGSGLWSILKSRFLSFMLILGSGGLLLISLAFSTVATAAKGMFAGTEGADWVISFFSQGFQTYALFGVITVLFAMIYRYLPDAKIGWRDVWLGAIVTSMLFEMGKSLMALYLGQMAISSFYGAAASIVVLMLWNFYTAQIFLYGAEITKAYSRHYRRSIVPVANMEVKSGGFHGRST